MSDIAGELARVRGAFEKPTLRLLDGVWAPFIVSVFKSSFSGERKRVQADRLHAQVDTYLAELVSVGVKVPPGRSGRALCVQWVRDNWLNRDPGEQGEEWYSLTSHTLEALTLVESLSKDRALLSESRLTTILETVRRWATEANPDREARIQRIDTEIARLSVERDRLNEGGEVFAASDERMLDGYANLMDLISQLPSDFKRVEESVAGMHRQIITDFREEERPIGEVLDDYLRMSDHLMDATAEGRAFDGAIELLRHDAWLLDLKTDLGAILEHPFASALTSVEQRSFRGTVLVIRHGIKDVLSRRSRLTSTLREHIVNHDVVKDRELEVLLREINKSLATWMESAGPRSNVPVNLMPGTPQVEHLRQRFYDPDSDAPPPPLADVSGDAPEPYSIEELRKQGGPLLAEMRQTVLDAFRDGGARTIGEVFNNLEPNLRRPVEILGLLLMATQIDALERSTDVELFAAIRPDNSRRTFEVPRMILDERDTASLAALEDGPLP